MAIGARRPLTEFGGMVLSLALMRGITTQKELARLVDEEVEEGLTQRRMSPWLHGQYAPPWWFCEALAEVLKLDGREMDELAWANTYGRKKPLNTPPR